MQPPAPLVLRFSRDGWVPNNPRLPAVVFPGALAGAGAADVARLYRENRWGGTWRFTVFDRHHYHSNAHEALACVAGAAVIRLGGPGGADLRLAAGDLAVLPAGTGHCRMQAEDGFSVVGAYPAGQEDCDLLWATEANWPGAEARIAAVALPEADPLRGRSGPLMALWGDAAGAG
ncbi:cupin [Paralimibaculum aggregatum]|uniref:Cupin n=1 Tax=Paralimibaculum aggregatum TaxID=3036245 RepID=A0ABQ6LMM2_9RHOB|nr:cupin [Limibaculum sp. NKW23]GMG84438.1 cupin [Limibaculum sp. NKW23]